MFLTKAPHNDMNPMPGLSGSSCQLLQVKADEPPVRRIRVEGFPNFRPIAQMVSEPEMGGTPRETETTRKTSIFMKEQASKMPCPSLERTMEGPPFCGPNATGFRGF